MLIKVAIGTNDNKIELALVNADNITSVLPRFNELGLVGSTINFINNTSITTVDSPNSILTKSRP